jgi:hypothetical protein
MKSIKEPLTRLLTETYNDFIFALKQFTDEQINEIPFEGSWTPGQVADHIIKATRGIPDQYTVSVDRLWDEKIDELEKVFLDFKAKYKSPDFVIPREGPFEKSKLIHTLEGIMQTHKNNILEKDLSSLCLNFELPGIGTMTRYEWYRFIVMHTKRHLFQLNNILSSLASPKNS